MRDQANALHVIPAIIPQIAADSTAIVGEIVDRHGYESVTFALVSGVLVDADATFAVTLEHGDAANLSDAAAVDAVDMVGTLALASFAFGDDSECRKLGYLGAKRYLRLTITPTGNDEMSGDMVPVPIAYAPFSAIAVLGHPLNLPTPNPPQ